MPYVEKDDGSLVKCLTDEEQQSLIDEWDRYDVDQSGERPRNAARGHLTPPLSDLLPL